MNSSTLCGIVINKNYLVGTYSGIGSATLKSAKASSWLAEKLRHIPRSIRFVLLRLDPLGL